MHSESRKTIFAALGANLAIAIAKLVAGMLGHSAALLAEAAHSTADTMRTPPRSPACGSSPVDEAQYQPWASQYALAFSAVP